MLGYLQTAKLHALVYPREDHLWRASVEKQILDHLLSLLGRLLKLLIQVSVRRKVTRHVIAATLLLDHCHRRQDLVLVDLLELLLKIKRPHILSQFLQDLIASGHN